MNDQKMPSGLTVCQQAKVFEPFRLDMVNLCLWRAQERMPLTPRAFDILRYLVEHADRLVTHDELLEALWPATYVNPEGIRKYILEIRKALGDRPKQPMFIATLPKRGYQFVAKIADGNIPPGSRALSDSRLVTFLAGEAGIASTTAQYYRYLAKPSVGNRGTCDPPDHWVAVAARGAPSS
jgi:DNA-binding winged helix-turn-helix (wHTH) protein